MSVPQCGCGWVVFEAFSFANEIPTGFANYDISYDDDDDGSAAALLLGVRVRIPRRAWMYVFCECCVLSGRSLCDGPIPLREKSYRLWCVSVCDIETSMMRQVWPELVCCARGRGE